jgi:hypothetical protein
MDDDQDWRLRADLADPAAMHAKLRDAAQLETEVKSRVGDDVVLSYDDDTLFAYTNTRAAIDRARRAIEAQLAADGAAATLQISHWDEAISEWHQLEPPLAEREFEREAKRDHEDFEASEARIETRTVAITSGRVVRNWFETTVADEARAAGVELSIVERPHLLTTQLAFTLTGPTAKVDEVIASLEQRAGQTTRLESYFGIIR